jgi:pimeloyl-ACP methyl ester carboxylesterase
MGTRIGPGARALLACGALTAAGCASVRPGAVVKVGPGDAGARIAGIDLCADETPGALELDPARPLVVLVHGCRSSGGRFRALAEVFASRGQQAVCFSYDDRDSIEASAGGLGAALEALQARLPPHRITVIAHSQGGLVARRALVADREAPLRTREGFTYRLVTVSSPFGGIRASSDCGKTWLHAVTLGVTVAICQAIAGDKWTEIHPRAGLVARPGTLAPEVVEVLKVVTDERGTCRRARPDGSCAESDDVFSVEEQRNAKVEADPRLLGREVRAGHAEIVGDGTRVPTKLLDVLEERGVLVRAPPELREATARLLARIYGTSERSAAPGADDR